MASMLFLEGRVIPSLGDGWGEFFTGRILKTNRRSACSRPSEATRPKTGAARLPCELAPPPRTQPVFNKRLTTKSTEYPYIGRRFTLPHRGYQSPESIKFRGANEYKIFGFDTGYSELIIRETGV